MSFIEPFLLWGTLAVTIPVVIHFWHQKQGKLLPWAATQWLTESQQQQSRGFRFDNVLLLIVRCLLLLLLAFLLAQPILNWFTKPPIVQKVHLVQPSAALASNFRFELTEATKKGERVVWANESLELLDDKPDRFQKPAGFSPIHLQTAINKLDPNNTELQLYVLNNQTLAGVPAITVPIRFHLHTLIDSTSQPRQYLVVQNGKKLFNNRAGKLTSSLVIDPALSFASAPAYSGAMYTLLNYRSERERRTVKAALLALTEVYSLDLQIDERAVLNRQYQWILTDQLPVKPSPQTLYVVSAVEQPVRATNVIYTNETLTPQTSERVETGRLPEWLGEQLLTHYGLKTNRQPLSQRDLQALFITSAKADTHQQAGLQNGLLLAFALLILFERWLALTKNA